MAYNAVDLRCPNCNSSISIDQKTCDWCHQPLVISTFTSVWDMPIDRVRGYADANRAALSQHPDDPVLNKSIAMCYLKLGLYDKAIAAFERAIEDNFDDSEVYFYAAICLLRGKKAFLAQRSDIDKAIEYINAANMIEPKGIYYYLLAYIKYDYFERKYLNTKPDFRECMATAERLGISDTDVKNLFDILKVVKPSF